MLTFPGFDRENDPIIWRIPDVPTAYGTFYDVGMIFLTFPSLFCALTPNSKWK